MHEVMIDIETLDTDVDTSVILSIGLLRFDGGGPLGGGLTIYPSVSEQQARGRTVGLGTVRFWATQEGGASSANEAMVPENARESVNDAWLHFRGFFRAETSHGEVDAVWANGDLFDVGLLTTLFRPNELPWRYNAVRDLRTLMREATSLGWTGVERSAQEAAHSAIGDCRHQIRQLHSVRGYLRSLGAAPREGLTVHVKEDGTWLDFGSSQLQAEALAEKQGGIIGKGIADWANQTRKHMGKQPLLSITE